MTINALKTLNLRPRNRTGGDCVVLALTFITGASYMDVEDVIKQHHSRYMKPESTRAHGVFTEQLFKDEFTIFGYKLTKLDDSVMNHRLWSFIKDHQNGTFFVKIYGHALVVKDGQQYDRADSSVNCPVLAAWIVTK